MIAATAWAGPLVEVRLERGPPVLEVGQHGLRRRQRQRVLDHRAARRRDVRLREAVVAELPRSAIDHVDELVASGDHADRKAAAKDLAVGGDVRPYVEQGADAALVGAEPRDDLVEHQQKPARVGEPAELAQEGDRLQVGVARPDRLDQHEREVIGMVADHLEGMVGAVLEHECVVDDTLGDARHHGHRAGIAARSTAARGRCRSGRGCRR